MLDTAHERLQDTPALVLLGPRQVGKTTLALTLGESRDTLYLDLESELDRTKLAEPELYLSKHLDKLVILDEIHRAPDLFPILRGLIDRGRREGRSNGLYLLLGSASIDLSRQSGESLAGRVSHMELSPFDVLETEAVDHDRLWLRGGFPTSFLSTDDKGSLRWRRDFIRTYLEREIPTFGPRVATESLRRLWVMLAHQQGGLLNVAQLARNIGTSGRHTASYIDLLVDLLLVRRLPPWHANVKKRLTRSPKIFVRDSGITHALLGICDQESLLSHPVVGASWENFAIENLIATAPEGTEPFFYRTGGGAEIDLLLALPSGDLWAIEIKRSLTPKPARGFHEACQDLGPAAKFVVYPGTETFPVKPDVEAIPLATLAQRLQRLDA